MRNEATATPLDVPSVGAENAYCSSDRQFCGSGAPRPGQLACRLERVLGLLAEFARHDEIIEIFKRMDSGRIELQPVPSGHVVWAIRDADD